MAHPSWNQQPLAEDDYDDDDLSSYDDSEEEDMPLQISSWGTQKVNDSGTTEVNLTMEGWKSLIDPNAKIGPNGIGTGNLHRRGANFKPVDEENILNHRLKKGPIQPKAPGSKKKKKKAPTPRPTPPPSARGRGGYGGRVPRPPPSTTRPPPSGMSGTGWGSGQLAETPFWEQPARAQQPPPQPQQPQPSNNWQAPSSGAAASKYATGASASKYAPQPTPPTSTGSAASRYATPTGSSASKYATPTPQLSQPPSASSSTTSFSSPATGAAASKYATGAAASKYAPQQQQQVPPTIPPPPPPAPLERKPILTFNIELVPGVSAPLNVYESSDPRDVVDTFEREHHLTMTPEAKQAFATHVAAFVQAAHANKNAMMMQ
ncbi:hypothetical protein O0I10_009411 [Lichtheimia ornata]|uniref:Uncharacterized protein n=1 Tax=Lichtheimia ornata TaxID=688661 RepID=A0AAD7XVZ4_9FUNG|nr:uncharacterized protein O0I10_009411 [Lichtheimia ornata]KAJ8654846.1 hypothetical protein O0I10_009411 [Lichtheimia ornata]